MSALERTVIALSGDTSELSSRLGSPIISGEIRFVGTQGEAWTLDGTFSGCAGVGQYDGLHRNGSVRIGDENGTVIAAADIKDTTVTGDICLMTFEVEVPESDTYIVELAPDDTVAYTVQTLEANDWTVSITRRVN